MTPAEVTGNKRPFVTRDELVADLEDRILGGTYPVGGKLPSERQLADQYGVSRPVVREVLRTLKERRLIEVHAGRGAFVRRVRSTDAASQMGVLFRRAHVTARNLIEARSTLECAAAELAAARAQAGDLVLLRKTLAGLAGSTDVVEQARLDLTFHFGIVRAARNPVIESMLAAVTEPMVELMIRSLIDPNVAETALDLHAEILTAIEASDGEAASRAMAEHIAVAAQFYGEDLDRSVETVARRELARRLAPSVTLEHVLERVVRNSGLAGDDTAHARANGSPGVAGE